MQFCRAGPTIKRLLRKTFQSPFQGLVVLAKIRPLLLPEVLLGSPGNVVS